ncbi:MAG: PilZ domain-containing protein [Persicimonas sp.]
MSSKTRRREPRIDLTLPVVLQMPDGELDYEINNASLRGVFIACPEPLPLHKLVRFQTELPAEAEPLQMLGLVAHTVNQTEARETGKTPGMGLQLFSVGRRTRERWSDFIIEEYEKDPEARSHVEAMQAERISVNMGSIEELRAFADEDLEEGSIFVRTSELSQIDETVNCDIIHPDGERSFALTARVLDVTESPRRERGMELEFVELDEDEREAFDAFVEGDQFDYDDVELLEIEPDPGPPSTPTLAEDSIEELSAPDEGFDEEGAPDESDEDEPEHA